jgi:hypothetical protein
VVRILRANKDPIDPRARRKLGPSGQGRSAPVRLVRGLDIYVRKDFSEGSSSSDSSDLLMRPEGIRVSSRLMLRCDHGVNVRRVIGIPLLIAPIESAAIVRAERQVAPQALDQIRIRGKVTAERNEVGIPAVDDRFRAAAFETASGDDPTAYSKSASGSLSDIEPKVPLGPSRTPTRSPPQTDVTASVTSSRKRVRFSIEPP